MMNAQSFAEQSYLRHQEHYKDYATEEKFKQDTDNQSADYWRHQRMYATVRSILTNESTSKWLTIGDGRFGLDAVGLQKIMPSIQILPTDISGYLLEIAKEKGFIKEYRLANAERLDFEDNHFDFAFCKESYHHFPRPMIAVYEMLRVSRKGIVLIEPHDWKPTPMLASVKNFIISILKGKRHEADSDRIRYEVTGNYIYSISQREIEKVALGLNYPHIAVKLFNDTHIPPNPKIPNEQVRLAKTKQKISQLDLICKLQMKNYNLMTAVIFKESINEKMKNDLCQDGFHVIDLPRNPYQKS